jgi:dephospho-CoA kinase
MYTELRVYSLEGALGELDRRTSSLGRLEARLANVERLTEAAADVTVLLAVIADPKATKARLEAPQKATQELEAGRAQLAADREASQKVIAEASADIERRRAAVLEREIARGLEDSLRIREASREVGPGLGYPTPGRRTSSCASWLRSRKLEPFQP